RSDVAGDLVEAVDRVPAELLAVLTHDLLGRRLVHAVRVDEALVVDDDVTVLPRDLRKVLFGELTRAAADRRHLILPHLEAANDHVPGHLPDLSPVSPVRAHFPWRCSCWWQTTIAPCARRSSARCSSRGTRSSSPPTATQRSPRSSGARRTRSSST